MNFQRNKSKLIIGAVLFILALLSWAIFWPQPPAPVRVTFLYSTNDLLGYASAFEVVNDLLSKPRAMGYTFTAT
jgi:hypothetical protein